MTIVAALLTLLGTAYLVHLADNAFRRADGNAPRYEDQRTGAVLAILVSLAVVGGTVVWMVR